MDNRQPNAREEHISVQEFRDRAYRLCDAIEQLLIAIMGDEVHVGEILLALHLVRRHMERNFERATDSSPEDRAGLLARVQEQRDSFDAHLAASKAKAEAEKDKLQ